MAQRKRIGYQNQQRKHGAAFLLWKSCLERNVTEICDFYDNDTQLLWFFKI